MAVPQSSVPPAEKRLPRRHRAAHLLLLKQSNTPPAMFTFIIGFVAGTYLSYITDNDSKDEK